MSDLFWFIDYVVNLYMYVVLAAVIFSWLLYSEVVNIRKPIVLSIWDALQALTEPLLRPIRRVTKRLLPNTGPLDFSVLVLWLLCVFVLVVVLPNLAKLLGAFPYKT